MPPIILYLFQCCLLLILTTPCSGVLQDEKARRRLWSSSQPLHPSAMMDSSTNAVQPPSSPGSPGRDPCPHWGHSEPQQLQRDPCPHWGGHQSSLSRRLGCSCPTQASAYGPYQTRSWSTLVSVAQGRPPPGHHELRRAAVPHRASHSSSNLNK